MSLYVILNKSGDNHEKMDMPIYNMSIINRMSTYTNREIGYSRYSRNTL